LREIDGEVRRYEIVDAPDGLLAVAVHRIEEVHHRRHDTAAAVEAEDCERREHLPAVNVVAIRDRWRLIERLRERRQIEAADRALRLVDHVRPEELPGEEEG